MAVPSAPLGFQLHNNSNSSPPSSYIPNPQCLTEEEIVERLEDYISQQCCADKDFVKGSKFHEILSVPILMYSLELFIEKRTKEWCTEPFRGEYIPPHAGVGFNRSVPVDIWTLQEPIPPGLRFGPPGNKVKVQREVPGSISVVNCARCSGIGSTQCGECQGSSMGPCAPCRATGYVIDQTSSERLACTGCHGRGRVGCTSCRTQGIISCSQCKGFRQVKIFEQMTITWTSTKQNLLNFSGDIKISSSKMSNVTGKLVIEDISPVPRELIGFPMSIPHFQKTVTDENNKPNTRILEIRQRIYQIPATEVIYEFKGKVKKFLVYGEQELVYFPKGLPTSCCTIT